MGEYSRYQFGEERDESQPMDVVETVRLAGILHTLGKLSVQSLRKIRDVAAILSIKRSEWDRLGRKAMK